MVLNLELIHSIRHQSLNPFTKYSTQSFFLGLQYNTDNTDKQY